MRDLYDIWLGPPEERALALEVMLYGFHCELRLYQHPDRRCTKQCEACNLNETLVRLR